ncbi:MAG: hypothetical protein IT307_18920, partial [Chloroflexi bacterium]|nr:hypothetical protein [Chloroflexota bacterium]
MQAITAPTALPRRAVRIGLGMDSLWLLLALVGPFILAAGLTAPVYDTWWSLKLGQLSVQAGRPVTDVVLGHAPTSGAAANGQWLAQVALYVAFSAGGEVAFRLLSGLSLSLSLTCILATARSRGAGPRAAALGLLVAAGLAIENVGARAPLLT